MNKLVILSLIFCFSSTALSKDKVVGVLYYQHIFGHILERQNSYSASMTTISCGFPLKVIEKQDIKSGWSLVEAAGTRGYLKSSALASSKPDCFQSKYPKFFNNNELSLSDMYYWGRLYDMYIQGKSKVK